MGWLTKMENKLDKYQLAIVVNEQGQPIFDPKTQLTLVTDINGK